MKSISGSVKSQIKQRLKTITVKINEDLEQEKTELNTLYDGGEQVTQ